MTERDTFIRESMRSQWAQRTVAYTAFAALHTARYAAPLLDRVAVRPGERVLDVATGPGVVAVAAAERVGPSGEVLATDLAPEWEAVVAQRAAEHGLGNVRFAAMGAERLELADASVDLALCQFGLMFVPDPVAALREMRRVLRPGGRVGVTVWSVAERAVYVSLPRRVLAAIMPPPAEPAQRLPGPLDLGEPRLLERHARAAGFEACTVEPVMVEAVFADPELFWVGQVVNGSAQVREAVEALDAAGRERLHETMIAELERYRRGVQIVLPSEALILTAPGA